MWDDDVVRVCREIITRLAPQYSGPIAPVLRAFADELEGLRKSSEGDRRVAVALGLRDHGATQVDVDGLSVRFGPRGE